MMDPNSFTSEPQYQRPDQRNSDIDFIRKLEPVAIPNITPVVAPVPVPTGPIAPTLEYGWDPTFVQRFLQRMEKENLQCTRLYDFGNSIPLGSFCYALAFIIYGFYRCKVYRINDTFLWSVILLFGGIGQCTAGFLEFCRGRGFPTAIYLTYGFYCLSHYAGYTIPAWFNINNNKSMLYNFTEDSICAFYCAMVVISFGILLGSIKTNCLYICQCLTAFAFFLLRGIGEACGSLGTKRQAAGILQTISGFFSLLLCFSQILNMETFYRPVFPTCPLDQQSDIEYYEGVPVTTAPVAAVPVV